MSDEVIHGLSADSKRIPSKWTRNTVADGSWLQNYTLSPLSARDFYLASAIDANTDDLLAKLEAEIEARKEGDNYISATLVSVSGDLVNVSSDFYDFSAKVENSASVINNTINVFSAKVEASADALDRKIDNETTRAQSKEDELLNKINTIEAGTDVINVFGSYGGDNGFSVESAYYFDPAKTAYHLTNNDVIKIINDEHTPVGDTENLTTGHQTYYQWVNKSTVTGDPTSPADGDWNFIGYTDPYYNISEINNIVSDLSATISANYYSAKNVKAGNNISAKYSTNGAPTVTLGLSSTILLDGVSSTNLSSQFVTAVNLSSNKVSATNLSATNVSATNLSATTISASELSATKVSAYDLSATKLSASTAYGQSAKFDNISATNLTALTATGNNANFTNFSGKYITGYYNSTSSLSSTISGLINSAANGGSMTGLKNVSAIVVNHNDKIEFVTSADEIGLYVSGTDWLGLEIDPTNKAIAITGNLSEVLEPYMLKAWSGWEDSIFSGTSRSAQSAGSAALAYSATTAYNAQNLGGQPSSYYLNSALLKSNSDGKISGYGNSAFVGGLTALQAQGTNLTAETIKITSGTGIDIKPVGTDEIRISANPYLLGSANSGQSAYNWITSKSATLSAGSGIEFASAQGAANTLGIYVTGVLFESSFSSWATGTNSLFSGTSRSAQSAGSASLAYSASLANSAAIAYNAQNLGGVLSSNIINSAKSGYAASSWIATNKPNIESASAKATAAYNVLSTATFSAKNTVAGNLSGGFFITGGPGVYINTTANGNKSGIYISAEGEKYQAGKNINISNDKKINLNDSVILSSTNGSTSESTEMHSDYLQLSSYNSYYSFKTKLDSMFVTYTGAQGTMSSYWSDIITASKLRGSDNIKIEYNSNYDDYLIDLQSEISASKISANSAYYKSDWSTKTYETQVNAFAVYHKNVTDGTNKSASWSNIIDKTNGRYISSNNTITAIVSAANVGGASNVLYLV